MRLLYRTCYLIFAVFILAMSTLKPEKVFAQVCYPSRYMEQYACVLGCVGQACCDLPYYACSGDPSRSCGGPGDTTSCVANGPYPNAGSCAWFCDDWATSSAGVCTNTGSFLGSCTSASAGCTWTGSITTCTTQADGTCAGGTQTLIYGCWGPGNTPTIAPGEPTPTPIVLCPNGQCDIAETCLSCPADCGSCPVGTLTARAVQVSASDTSCNAVTASTNYLLGTTISFNPAVVPSSQTQGSGILTWANVYTSGSTLYTVSATPPDPHTLGNICVSQNGAGWTQNASENLTIGGTNAYAIAFLPQAGWVQTKVGNVYAGGQLTASIPATATNPYFSLVGDGGTPGIVTYGTDYDFSLSSFDKGETQVSSTNWLVNQSYTPVNYFERFNYTLRNATKTAIIDSLDSLTQPSCATSPCIFTIEGNVITAPSSPWIIGANEQIIMLVNGNATISSNITITSGGFFSLIVNGTITVDPTVDTLHGIYVTSTDTAAGMFISSAGTTQLTVKGSVIADRFSLLRDLDTLNDTTPGEIFELDPELLFTMPDSLKEAPYIWREVAP